LLPRYVENWLIDGAEVVSFTLFSKNEKRYKIIIIIINSKRDGLENVVGGKKNFFNAVSRYETASLESGL
jgi:hypothetical protein